MPEPTLRVHPWKRSPLSLEERALEIERQEAELRRMTRSLYVRYGFEYVAWLAIGLFLLFWSFRTNDTRYAGLCFWGGIGLGDAGMLMTLIRARKEADKCGLF